jgi:hypothetical protein
MIECSSVGELAREVRSRHGVVIRPRDISDLFYNRLLTDDRCPIVGGRRMIPRDFVPNIEEALSVRGLIERSAQEVAR